MCIYREDYSSIRASSCKQSEIEKERKSFFWKCSYRELPYFGTGLCRGRLLWTSFNISHTQYTWNNMHHYYLHLMQSFLRGTGYVEQLKLDLSALHHQLVDDALSYSIWNNGPWYTSNCAWMANCGAESLLRVAFTRRGLTKLCIIICYVLNEIKN